MDELLATTFCKLKSKKYSQLNIVMGNESCDLDSAVCSVVLATFLNWLEIYNKEENEIGCVTISILDVDREDYPLKTEVAYCLKECGIIENNLLFRDDVNLKELVNNNQTNITLVDHHVLSKRLDFLTQYVKEIVDHRPLDKQQWNYSNDVKTLIKIVGSCATLIVQRIQDVAEGIEFFNTYPVCAHLLHSVIILDTVNFSKEVNKATPLDMEMVDYLESVLKLENCEQTRQLKLEQLLKARSDVTSLTSSQLLRKDLKILADMFVPSFPILVKEFLQKPKALEAVSEALNTKNCTIAVLLGMDLTDGLKRDVAVLSPSCPDKVIKLAKFLQDWSRPNLELVPEAQDCVYFKQSNLTASRKQYMPALNEYLKNCQQ